MDLARTLLFLYRMLAAPDRRPGEPLPLSTPEGPVEADVYRPTTDPWSVVLILHGLALRGHRDPRLTNIGRALAAAGVLAVAPRIDAMARLHLHPPASVTIAAVLRTMLEHPDLGRPATVGVFGPSFSGSQALLAAAQPDLRDRIGGMLLIGAYADPRTLAHHVLDTDEADPYGRLILLRHFLEASGELTDSLAEAIDTDLADMGLEPEEPGLPGVLDRLPATERERFLSLRDDREVRRELVSHLLEEHGEVIDELEILHAVPELRAPVTLLHGAHDPVIPPSESAKLRDALHDAGRTTLMVTTALLDHGNVMAGGRAALEAPSAVGAFHRWFGSVRRPERYR